MYDDLILYLGEPVKALGAGRVGGCLVRFGSADAPDCQGEYFTPQTDFGLDVAAKARVVYHHGFPRRGDPLSEQLGKGRIGTVELTAGPDGLYADGTLDLSRPPVKALYAEIEAGRIGWSSGSTERLVDRLPVKAGVREIRSWPIVEASLSPVPVDPRCRAVAVKSLLEDIDIDAAASAQSIVDCAAKSAADLGALRDSLARFAKLGQAKREAVKALLDAVSALDPVRRDLSRLLGPDPASVKAFRLALLRDDL